MLYSNKYEWTTGTCNNMDAFHRYCIEWKKPGTKDSYYFNSFIWKGRTGSLIGGDRNLNSRVTLLGGGRAQTFQGAGNILYLDMGVGCMCASLCKNSSNSTLIVHLCLYHKHTV